MNQLAADEKTCPYCAETIKAAAKVCKHCKREQTSYTDSTGYVWHKDPPRTTSAGATFGRLLLLCIVAPIFLFAFAAATPAGGSAWHLALVMLVVGVAIYFLPSYEAWARSHPNFTGVFLLNLLLGWTLLGWVVALVWGASSGRRS